MEKIEPEELVFFFMPFSGLKISVDAPILTYVFEEQEDRQIANYFPEIEARRQSVDKIIRKGEDATIALQSVARDDTLITLGMVYIKYPWKKRKEFDPESIIFLREVAQSTVLVTQRIREQKFTKAIIVLPSKFSPQNIQSASHREQLHYFVKTIAESIVYANSPYDDFISQKDARLKEITFVFFGESQPAVDGFLKTAINSGSSTGSAMAFTRRLIELPPNLKSPIEFVGQACEKTVIWKPQKNWQKFQVSPQIEAKLLYGLGALKSRGFQLIAGVGQGSSSEPCLLKLHYRPRTNRKKKIKRLVLTGKGVTFDSGGYDMKDSEQNENMHYDVAGAATVVGAMRLAEENNLAVELIAILPLVINAVSSKALAGGSILKAYGGTTVEIVDTDCEGRLLMAEAIAFGEKKYKPDATITVATLSDLTDHGPDFLKVITTNSVLEKKAKIAEKHSTEKMFLYPPMEHFNQIDNMHVGAKSDLVNDVWGCYHTSPTVFMYNFFSRQPVDWVFIDICAVFEDWASTYGAGPGFGLKFLWYLLQQFA